MPMTSTPLSGFPDAKSAGVRAGADLKVHDGDMTVTTDGAVISNLEIRGTLRIEADNVTVRDCKIVGDSYHNILIPDPYNATVEHCDIVGGQNGISGAGTFRGNDISQTENGINVYGASLIEDNYIHDLAGGPDAHFDGIENNGASGMVLRHNTIINEHGQTAAVMLNNEFGSIKDAIIEDNYLAGGGYTIYSDGRKNPSDPIEGVQITDNVIGEGYYGNYAFMENDPLVRGNTEVGKNWPTPVSGGQTDPGDSPPGVDDPGVDDPGVDDPGTDDPDTGGPVVNGPDGDDDGTGDGGGHHGGRPGHWADWGGCGRADGMDRFDDDAFRPSELAGGFGGHKSGGRSWNEGERNVFAHDWGAALDALEAIDIRADDDIGHHARNLDHHAFSI